MKRKIGILVLVLFVFVILVGCDQIPFLPEEEDEKDEVVSAENALAGRWSRAELNDDGGTYDGYYSVEAYQFETDNRMFGLDQVCDTPDCTGTIAESTTTEYTVTYGNTVESTGGLTVYEVDFAWESDGSQNNLYTIIHVDSSADPQRMAFGDQDVDPNRDGSSADKRILSLGPDPEYFDSE